MPEGKGKPMLPHLLYNYITLVSCCSLTEQLESMKISMDERGLSALKLFFECKEVKLLLNTIFAMFVICSPLQES